MEDRNINERKIISLKDGENYTIPESDYGRAEIWYINDYYIVFGIPVYGGAPMFPDVISGLPNKEKQVNKVLDLVDTWT